MYNPTILSKEKPESGLSQREKNKANRRTAVIETARRSFFEKGFENTAMSALSKRFCEKVHCPRFSPGGHRFNSGWLLGRPGVSRHRLKFFHERGPAINHMMASNFLGRQMLAGVIRVDDVDEGARMLIDLCTAGYHDRVLLCLQFQDKSEDQQQAKRVVKQFLRCYGRES